MTCQASASFANSGEGPSLVPWDIGHSSHMAVIGSDTAFWALVPKSQLGGVFVRGGLLDEYDGKRASLREEMDQLRFGLKPSCVYFNPTERCNLDCSYCYLPSDARRYGRHMSVDEAMAAMEALWLYFGETLPPERRPQLVFHGAEPLLNREAVFAVIERYSTQFRFGMQTNATLLDDSAIEFLTKHRVAIGLSLDASEAVISDATRTTWGGGSTHELVALALSKLRGYPDFNLICTISKSNVQHLVAMVNYLHALEVPTCMLNVIRCTMPRSKELRVDDDEVAQHYLAALDRSHDLYCASGRKLVVANFANALIAILAPTARRQMCDISPCGGGRSFFAVAATGDLYPCSEFLGLPEFRGGNLFREGIGEALKSRAFLAVSQRTVDSMDPCRACVIRHFCGAPCPAEAYTNHGSTARRGSYCRLYEEQIRYAFRTIADKTANDYLWDDWASGTRVSFGEV